MIYIFKQSHCQGLTINAYHDLGKQIQFLNKRAKLEQNFQH